MITAVVSDLHFGARMSLLCVPHARRRLIAELRTADQLVLLGDVLALRDAPAPTALEHARPFFEELDHALAGRRIVIVPGNHDYQLAEPLLERRRLEGAAADELAVEWPVAPGAPGLAGWIADRLRSAELLVAYPGLWIRPDVYATHGHYLDCHMTFPRLECLVAALMVALSGGLPEDAATPQDYEAVLAPIYAFAHSRAQAALAARGDATRLAGLWRQLKAHGRDRVKPGSPVSLGSALAGAALGLAFLMTRRQARVGSLKPDLSPAELGRAGVRAMGEVVARLGVDAEHVLFGHIHRAGPLDGEDAWMLPGGARLLNTGSWVYSPTLLDNATERSPYWPGTCALVTDSGPPQLRHLLDEGRPPGATA